MGIRNSFNSSMILLMGSTAHNYKLWELGVEEGEGCSSKNRNSMSDRWSCNITVLHMLWGIRMLHCSNKIWQRHNITLYYTRLGRHNQSFYIQLWLDHNTLNHHSMQELEEEVEVECKQKEGNNSQTYSSTISKLSNIVLNHSL